MKPCKTSNKPEDQVSNLENYIAIDIQIDNREIVLSYNMTRLHLSDINLDFIPEILIKMIYLQDLCLSKNNIYIIPGWIEDFQNLKHIDLSSNKILCMPAFLDNMTNLTFLDLYDNKIEEMFCDLENLECFDIAFNFIDEIDTEVYLVQKKKLREKLSEVRNDGSKDYYYSYDNYSDESNYESSVHENNLCTHEYVEENWDCDDDDFWTPDRIILPKPNFRALYDSFADNLIRQGHFCPKDIHPGLVPKTVHNTVVHIGQFDDATSDSEFF